MTGYRLRAASQADAPEIARLHGESFARPWSAREVAALLAPPGAALVTSDHADGTLAGFIIGRIVVDEAEILSVAVASSGRRRGKGRTLVRAFLDLASARGARRIFLEVAAGNSNARALYERAGFQVTGVRRAYYEVPGEPAEDAVVMVLDLALAAGGRDGSGRVD